MLIMTELIYWSHKLPRNIEVVEISGGEDASPALWKALALQLFAEHSDDGWRTIDHYPSGVPMLANEEEVRISVSHTGHFMAIALMPEAPEPLADKFTPGYALGIDVEKRSRSQVLRVRDKFLNDAEKQMLPPDDVEANILAWTIKEACYKAMLHPGLDFKRDIQIISLPEAISRLKGEAICKVDNAETRLTLCTWVSDNEYIITVAYA